MAALMHNLNQNIRGKKRVGLY